MCIANTPLANMLAICEHWRMQIADLRTELGLGHEAFAAALGLKSRAQAYEIEKGSRRPSIAVALKIEELSNGRIKAADLNDEIALVQRHLAANDTAPPNSEAA